MRERRALIDHRHGLPVNRQCRLLEVSRSTAYYRPQAVPEADLSLMKEAQFTSEAFTGVLKAHGITISMDGKGRWMDNVFVERLWRSVKYEDIHLKAYQTPKALQDGLKKYFNFYNTRRRHRALGRRTPDAVYFGETNMPQAA